MRECTHCGFRKGCSLGGGDRPRYLQDQGFAAGPVLVSYLGLSAKEGTHPLTTSIRQLSCCNGMLSKSVVMQTPLQLSESRVRVLQVAKQRVWR